MALSRLVISGLRNIDSATIDLSPGLNLFQGDNGSGKTSLLEAVHLLGLGRSFRALRHRRLIHDGRDALTVFGQCGDHRLGIEKLAAGDTSIRVDGVDATIAALAYKLPLQLFDPVSLEVMTGPSQDRRQLLDWAVFHVEPAFQHLWQRNQRALKQRNSLLKSARISPIELSAWEQELVETATEIERLRRRFFTLWQPRLSLTLQQFLPDFSMEIDWYAGWDVSRDLAALLHEMRGRDAERGFTQCGPHRADLKVRVQHEALADRLSRGQIKLAAFAVRLSLTEHLSGLGRQATLLVDDLASELDASARRRACEGILRLGAQTLMTAIEAQQILDCCDRMEPVALFHVEQGRISRMSD